MPGPAKRSNAHKAATGSRKQHQGEDLAPKPITRAPLPPKDLSEVGVAEWRRIVNLLVAEQILTKFDLQAVYVMCCEWEIYKEALDDIREKGMYMSYDSGHEQVRPVVAAKNQAFANYSKLLRHFGGDPEARAKVKRVRPPEKKKSKFDGI